MIKLIKNADVYAPEHIGKKDILIADGRIAAIDESIAGFESSKAVESFDMRGARVAPGYIDMHMHITGGGGEQGFASRVCEANLSEITSAGVTSVVGLLGTDGITRSLENLYAKTCALTEEGITAYMLTGSYAYPSVTLLDSVSRDIALIDKVIGVKLAVSDHRSSQVSTDEFLRVASEARLGGLLSAKAGILVMHMGDGKAKLEKLFYAIDKSEIPIETFLPTHVERTDALTFDAAKFAKLGGNIDFTAGNIEKGGTARSMIMAMDMGASIDNFTMSSDAYGSQPKFDKNRNIVSLSYSKPTVLNDEIKLLTGKYGVPLEKALLPLTKNCARVLKKQNVKGGLFVGADADIIVYDDELSIDHVFAKGKLAVYEKKPILHGKFERTEE